MGEEPHDFVEIAFRNSKSKNKKMIEAYQKGLSLREVGRSQKEYPVLLKIVERWKSGVSLNSIARQLNEHCVPSPRNQKWSWNTVANILNRIKDGRMCLTEEGWMLR